MPRPARKPPYRPASHEGALLLGLDFDGTLAPLAARPELARLPARNRGILERLKGRRSVLLAVISGRSLKDVREKVGVRGIFYAGNHGLEIDGPDGRWVHPQARALSKTMQAVARDLSDTLGKFPGVLIENKGLTLSVHYRNLPRAIPTAPLHAMLLKLLEPYRGRLKVTLGRKVWEVRPRIDWDKGHALLKLLRPSRRRWTAAFVGDDNTDEECFGTLGPEALTVRVGTARSSKARFRVKRQADVGQFLEFITREWS